MIPFVTEEIYRYIPGSEGLLAARPAGGSGDAAWTRPPRRAWRG